MIHAEHKMGLSTPEAAARAWLWLMGSSVTNPRLCVATVKMLVMTNSERPVVEPNSSGGDVVKHSLLVVRLVCFSFLLSR